MKLDPRKSPRNAPVVKVGDEFPNNTCGPVVVVALRAGTIKPE